MPRTVEHEELQKHTLHLYVGDFAKLTEMYARNGGASVFIRRLIRAHINKINAGVAQVAMPDVETGL
jgi:hypothetical protein